MAEFGAGPTSACRRKLGGGGSYPGLSGCDDRILRRYLVTCAPPDAELYTGVPVGPLPDCHDVAPDGWLLEHLRSNWPWRLDAMLRVGGRWRILECKPSASHSAVGQVLFYRYWLERTPGFGSVGSTSVLTDESSDAVVEFGASLDVEVVRLGAFSPPLR